MASPLQAIDWEACLLVPMRDREAEALLKREAGSVPGWAHYFLAAPWLAKALIRLTPGNGMLVRLDFHTADLISLVVSQESSCRYCYAATRMQLRILGMSEERVQALEQRLVRPELDAVGAAVVRFSRRMARGNPLAGADDIAPLRAAGMTDEEIREVAFVVSCVAAFNRVSTIAALPPQPWEAAPDLWYMRLFAPVLKLMARGWNKRGVPTPLERMPNGPFAGLVQNFDGSPIGPALANAMDDLWASPILPRRAKALMVAVIGRGLGCELSCQEACRVLEAEGLPESRVNHVLSHLGGPDLDPRERALVSFARDTIWYEPGAIQRRARELRESLPLPEFVEALGVASLANSICRLSAALHRPQ